MGGESVPIPQACSSLQRRSALGNGDGFTTSDPFGFQACALETEALREKLDSPRRRGDYLRRSGASRSTATDRPSPIENAPRRDAFSPGPVSRSPVHSNESHNHPRSEVANGAQLGPRDRPEKKAPSQRSWSVALGQRSPQKTRRDPVPNRPSAAPPALQPIVNHQSRA